MTCHELRSVHNYIVHEIAQSFLSYNSMILDTSILSFIVATFTPAHNRSGDCHDSKHHESLQELTIRVKSLTRWTLFTRAGCARMLLQIICTLKESCQT